MTKYDEYVTRERQSLQDRIDKLYQENQYLSKQLEEMQRYKHQARFYIKMQKHIQEHDAIRDSWKEFLVMYQMAMPDVREID